MGVVATGEEARVDVLGDDDERHAELVAVAGVSQVLGDEFEFMLDD